MVIPSINTTKNHFLIACIIPHIIFAAGNIHTQNTLHLSNLSIHRTHEISPLNTNISGVLLSPQWILTLKQLVNNQPIVINGDHYHITETREFDRSPLVLLKLDKPTNIRATPLWGKPISGPLTMTTASLNTENWTPIHLNVPAKTSLIEFPSTIDHNPIGQGLFLKSKGDLYLAGIFIEENKFILFNNNRPLSILKS